MDLAGFEDLVRRSAAEIPEEFLDGISEIVVSPRTVAHPERGEIFTLGECIPLPTTSDEPDALRSRVVLYHGSFQALARDQDDFDWHQEVWETLTHEIRHHVEWRAREPALEAFDEATEQPQASPSKVPCQHLELENLDVHKDPTRIFDRDTRRHCGQTLRNPQAHRFVPQFANGIAISAQALPSHVRFPQPTTVETVWRRVEPGRFRKHRMIENLGLKTRAWAHLSERTS